MTQSERRERLIKELLYERADFGETEIPSGEDEQRRLLRALMNIRPAGKASDSFLAMQDEYLKNRAAEKGIVDIFSLEPAEKGIYLWQDDITRLKCGAIVNAANSGMTGCYIPCHSCIDNCIHTFAGVQLRLECAELVKRQGAEEATGGAKITNAYNLPCRYVIHTVGPIVTGAPTIKDEALLRNCYLSCLETAEENGVSDIAFCCISTGEFRFPPERAAEIAVQTVRNYIATKQSKIKVVFNVFKNSDREIYKRLLGKNSKA